MNESIQYTKRKVWLVKKTKREKKAGKNETKERKIKQQLGLPDKIRQDREILRKIYACG